MNEPTERPPAGEPGPPEPTTDRGPLLPLWALVRAAHLAERAYTEVFARDGLSPAQYGVLACLADGDDLSQADLARAVFVRPQSMARLITDMVRAGLVTRTGQGGRGRRIGLSLTERGRRAQVRGRAAAYAFDQPGQVGLTTNQAHELAALLGSITAHLSAPEEPDRSDEADEADKADKADKAAEHADEHPVGTGS